MQSFQTPRELLDVARTSDTMPPFSSAIASGLNPNDKEVFYHTDAYLFRDVTDAHEVIRVVEQDGIERVHERIEKIRFHITRVLEDQGYIVCRSMLRVWPLLSHVSHVSHTLITQRDALLRAAKDWVFSGVEQKTPDLSPFLSGYYQLSKLLYYDYDTGILSDPKILYYLNSRGDKFQVIQHFADWLEELRTRIEKEYQTQGNKILRLPQQQWADDNVIGGLTYPVGQRIADTDLVYKRARLATDDVESLVLPDDHPYLVFERVIRPDRQQALVLAPDHKDVPTFYDVMPSLTSVEKIKVIVDAMLGCRVAHDAGFAHRDIKPHNIFVLGKGGELKGKLFDWETACRQNQQYASTICGFFGRMSWEGDNNYVSGIDYRRDDLINFILLMMYALTAPDKKEAFLRSFSDGHRYGDARGEIGKAVHRAACALCFSQSLTTSLGEVISAQYTGGIRELAGEIAAEFGIHIEQRGEYEMTSMPTHHQSRRR